MKRVVIDRFGGPEVVSVVDEAEPLPRQGEVRVRVLASGVSLSDAQMRAGTYLGGPKPPFTPGYELIGVVDQLGPGCARLHEGDRVGVLTQWGANAELVCVPEKNAVPVPEDLDPAEVVSLVFTYMTAYQMLHRAAGAKAGETLLVHGAAGRVGTAVLELAAVMGVHTYGTASAHDRAAVERLGAVAIDYQHEDFLEKVRELSRDGVDIVLDPFGGTLSLRSFRALRSGGRLVIYGRQKTLVQGRKNWPGVFEWYMGTAAVALWGVVSPSRRVLAYRIQKLRIHHQDWFEEDFRALLELLRRAAIHPVVAERLPLAEARKAHELLDSMAATGKLVLVS
ncbi:medium chain dehydrogenase/reductase family protein [Mycobacterium sp. Y57]|uniref:medium chain dehydrogenase/reductase family protein n=1 Tax=Mycolicibacterium xanthum TaxID=2796469 RepID=UPI001C843CD6|nr:medium chain dehydrogenase/reductase family protein [Mycolicibacterium xanthum]MBX7432412.1 medium chain dehydrogenase/reductase family protein [Mycolicibacterium xanthum]